MLILLVLPLSLLGRKSFRRVEDGSMYAERVAPPPAQTGAASDDMVKVALTETKDDVVVVTAAHPLPDTNGNVDTKNMASQMDAANESNV